MGSGLVERAIAALINLRMKKRGILWKRANATVVVTLRVQEMSAEREAAALHNSHLQSQKATKSAFLSLYI